MFVGLYNAQRSWLGTAMNLKIDYLPTYAESRAFSFYLAKAS